jgi:hypothetical protein
MMERTSRPLFAVAIALAAALAARPGAAAAQVQRVERPATEATRIAPLAQAGPRSRAYTTSVPGVVSLTQNAAAGAGMNPGWLAALQFPRGQYVVFGSATFGRSDAEAGHTVAVSCQLEGLDRTYTVEFNIHPTQYQPDPSVTIPFNVAGTGAEVHLKCGGNATEVSASNIVLSAIAVDELHRQ